MHDRPRDCRSRRNHVNERCASANGHAQHERRIGSFRGTSDRGSRPTQQPLGIRCPQRTLVLDFVAPDDRHQQIGATHRLGRGGRCENNPAGTCSRSHDQVAERCLCRGKKSRGRAGGNARTCSRRSASTSMRMPGRSWRSRRTVSANAGNPESPIR